MSKKMTNAEFIERIAEIYGDEFETLTEYIDAKHKVRVKHKCGYERDVAPFSLLSGSRCPNCSNKIKRTTESFKKEIFEKFNGEYEVLGEYVNTHTYIEIYHKECGITKKYKPKDFINQAQCGCSKEPIKVKKFKEKLKKKYNDEYILIGDYYTSEKVTAFKHTKCENTFDTAPSRLLSGESGCPKCSGKEETKRLKRELNFKKRLEEKFNGEYEVLSKYINGETEITVKHKSCGTIIKNKPKYILNSKSGGCEVCLQKLKYQRRHSQELFESRIYEAVGKEYTIKGEYINSQTKVLAIHNTCNREFMLHPNHFLASSNPTRCPHCAKESAGEYHKSNTEDFKERVYELYGDEYTVLGEYVNARTPIEIFHKECGRTMTAIPDYMVNRGGCCKSCALKRAWLQNPNRRTTEIFSETVYEITNGEYELIGEYIRNDIKTEIRHKECGNIFKVSPGAFLGRRDGSKRGTRCSYCNESAGESKVKIFLEKHNIEYVKEFSFDDLVGTGGRQLRFDFAIFKDGKLFMLCEYDGQLHFEKSGISNLEKQIEHDRRKNEYCKEHRIKLLRIHYKDYDNIEQILIKKVISKLIPR